MEKKSHARYYQNLLHRYLGFKPKLTVLSTRDSDFLYHIYTRVYVYVLMCILNASDGI